MKTRTFALVALFIAGCATTETAQTQAPSSAANQAEAEKVQKPIAHAEEHHTVGFEPLPQALAQDPTKVKIPELSFNVVKPERMKLDNGLELYLMPDHTVPLINLRAQLYLGTIEEPADKLGVADTMFDLMTSGGAGKLDADQLDELLEFHAANASAGAGDEISSLDFNIRSEDFEALMPVFADMLLRPRFQKDRFDISIARQIEGVKRRPDSPDGLAMRAVKKAVYGPEAYFGREKTEKTLKGLSVADLQSFHGKYVVPKATALLITGDFDKDKMLARVKELFGSWKGGERPNRVFPPPSKLQRRVIFVPREVAQTKIRIGDYGFKRLSPEEYAVRVMSNAMGGGIGAGRMWREVRDEKGLAYSAWAMAQPGPSTGIFIAGVDTRPEQTAQAIDATLQIIDDARGRKPFTTDEISLAADMFLNSFAFRFDEPEKIAREKAVYDVFGYPEDYLDHFRDNIAKVDVEATTKAAVEEMVPDALQIIVVGPKKLEPSLEKFGPVTTITDVEAFR